MLPHLAVVKSEMTKILYTEVIPLLPAPTILFSYPARARIRGTICSTSVCTRFIERARLYASDSVHDYHALLSFVGCTHLKLIRHLILRLHQIGVPSLRMSDGVI